MSETTQPTPSRLVATASLACSIAAAVFCFGARAAGLPVPPAVDRPVDFVRDVAPIFEEHCYECHGPDEQEAELRLDARAVVFKGGESGPLFEPGQSAESLLLERLTADDEDERMPEDGDPLAAEQIGLIRAWIDQGAHWPEGFGATVEEGPVHWAYLAPVRPSLPQARNGEWPRNAIDRFVLARIEAAGLTPSPPADRARLLRRVSLDLIGLPPTAVEARAFEADQRPDAYERVVERLLASPHYGERWATPWLDAARYADSNGFQRDNVRESWPYRDWVIRALNADMPFDEFTIHQIGGDLLPNATREQKIATGFHRGAPVNTEAGVDEEENRVNQVVDRVNVTGEVWLGSTIGCAQCHTHKYDPFTQREYYELYAYFNNTLIETALQSEKATASVDLSGPFLKVTLSPQQLARKRSLTRKLEVARVELRRAEQAARMRHPAWERRIQLELTGPGGSDRALPESVRSALAVPAGKRSAAAQKTLVEFFLAQHPDVRALRTRVAVLERESQELRPHSTLVMVEGAAPRETHVLERGDFLDPGKRVHPGTPSILHALPPEAPSNRLGLARWLVSPENPLVGRVTVNRAWAEFFGRGLVASTGDFGTQGELPTHPELLDWLALDFVETGWSQKALHRLIVTSSTYRQSSHAPPSDWERDPANELYARGPRNRLAAEFVRDNALAVSGLLDRTLYGPPVRPPQPEGVWRMIGETSNEYIPSAGGDRYRRGIYTIWRRSAPYPSYVNFDAPDRNASCTRRGRSNTPLQALNLLNDPVFVEAAAALALQVESEKQEAPVPEQVAYAFRLVLARDPSGAELERIERLYREELERFRADPSRAYEVIEDWRVRPGQSVTRLAALFFVANALLNLDETITKG